jgi:hypothetical protein
MRARAGELSVDRGGVVAVVVVGALAEAVDLEGKPATTFGVPAVVVDTADRGGVVVCAAVDGPDPQPVNTIAIPTINALNAVLRAVICLAPSPA